MTWRFRRVARLGGHPVSRGWLYGEPRLLPFEPTPVDQQQARKEVERAVAGLVPHGTDEATGHAPANLINSMADQWVDDIEAEYSRYLTKVSNAVGQAKAAEAELGRLHGHDLERLAELAAARDAAYTQLAGDRHGGKPVAPGAGGGYTDHGLVAGRPPSTYVHLAALTVAAAADFGAFSQIVQLVMKDQPDLISYLVVGGLTAVALCLAHSIGTIVRDRVAGLPSARRWIALGALAGWLGLGAASFWVRLVVVPHQSAAASGGLRADGGGLPTTPVQAFDSVPIAIIFAALYVGTGVVAAVGAYLTHNPRKAAYTKLRRAHDRAAEQEAALAAAAEMAAERRNTQVAARDDATRLRDTERHQRRAFAEQLKQHARVLLAHHHQDPAATDALLDDDRRPYGYEKDPT